MQSLVAGPDVLSGTLPTRGTRRIAIASTVFPAHRRSGVNTESRLTLDYGAWTAFAARVFAANPYRKGHSESEPSTLPE